MLGIVKGVSIILGFVIAYFILDNVYRTRKNSEIIVEHFEKIRYYGLPVKWTHDTGLEELHAYIEQSGRNKIDIEALAAFLEQLEKNKTDWFWTLWENLGWIDKGC